MHGAAISLWRGTSKVYRKTLWAHCGSQSESLGRRQSERAAAVWPKGLAQRKKIAMSIIPTIFRALLLAIFFGAYIHLRDGKEGLFPIPVARHLPWNDFITQIRFLPQDSREAPLKKELPVIQRFLKEHETETSVGVYDLAVFRVDRPGLRAPA